MKALIIILGSLAVIFGMVAIIAILDGWILCILWRWFIVPLFGLPELNIGSAIGISLIIGLLTGKKTDNQKKEEKENGKTGKSFNIICIPLLILFVGWIVHLFM